MAQLQKFWGDEGTPGKASNRNRELEWVLVSYQDPDAKPGVVSDHATADATMKRLGRRARFEAMMRGVYDPTVAEDAVGNMLEKLGRSNLTKRFRRAKGTPRVYIHKILTRFVQRQIFKQRSRQELPLEAHEPVSNDDPAGAVELADTARVCDSRIASIERIPSKKKLMNDSVNHQYLRKHRERKRRWKAIADLFPNRSFRPKRRKWKV